MKKIKMLKEVFKSNLNWTRKEKRVLLGIGGFIFALVIGFFGYLFYLQNSVNKAFDSQEGKEIQHSRVCMVNGDIKLHSVRSVTVNGKTYWGCCQHCISLLRYNTAQVRFTTDPVTGKKINKADAVIFPDPHNSRRAMFFQSDSTYEQYVHR